MHGWFGRKGHHLSPMWDLVDDFMFFAAHPHGFGRGMGLIRMLRGIGWVMQRDQLRVPSNEDVDRVKGVIKNVALGPKFVNRWGMTRIPLLYNNVFVGMLFEDVDLGSVDVRGVWKANNLVKAHLVRDDKIVGWVLISLQ